LPNAKVAWLFFSLLRIFSFYLSTDGGDDVHELPG